MSKKIAILRGINVGGKRKILMNDLKLMLNEIGLTDIATYIQSGNVIFQSNLKNNELADLIASTIEEKYGFDVPVVIRSADELEKSIIINPFYSEEADINKLHLTFLKEAPDEKNLTLIETLNFTPDKFEIINKDVFIHCEGKYHQSKLTNNFFEKKLKVGATTRNWKTVLKLLELSKT